jgi:hypothetical protein
MRIREKVEDREMARLDLFSIWLDTGVCGGQKAHLAGDGSC